jgi:hypothetical protein
VNLRISLGGFAEASTVPLLDWLDPHKLPDQRRTGM